MNLLSAESLARSHHDNWLFQDLNLGISQGEKLALVGNNGVGKSTLLGILAGTIKPDRGNVSIREGVTLGFLSQQAGVADSAIVRDILFDESNSVARVVREYEACVQDPDASPVKLQALLEQMEDLNAWDYEAKVKEITGSLDVGELGKSFGELSGGQRKRVLLAQLLLREPDLFILDEPTNHLDIAAIEWLEKYLSAQRITLIMVTHDRYFLDNVADQILELDRGTLYRYKGNYAYFLEKKAEREEALKAEVARARNLLRRELEWMRRQPKARGTKAKYRIEAFHELQARASQDVKKDKMELDIKEARQGGKVLEVHYVSKRFDDRLIINDFSYIFKKKDRIGIVGKNGAGKSTFLDVMTGRLNADSGEVVPGVTTRFGYFTQESVGLNAENRVIDEVKSIAEFITLSDGSQVSASRFLEMFLFPPEKQYTFINRLSGGERKLLQLLKVLVDNPNFLILDEPTNDFDIDTLNVLEDFLEKFQGCLLLVSHDRYFMDHLVDQLFIFEGDGEVKFFNGNYTDYRAAIEEEEVRNDEANRGPAAPAKMGTPPGKRRASFTEKIEYESLQREIEELEARKRELTDLFYRGTTDHQQLRQWGEELQGVEARIEEKMTRWIELADRVEQR